MKHTFLVARLATSNISTEDFSYLTTVLMETKTCENCVYKTPQDTCLNRKFELAYFSTGVMDSKVDGCTHWEKKND